MDQNQIRLSDALAEFLGQRGIRLHQTQLQVCELLFAAADKDAMLYSFFSSPMIGASFLFGTLDAFCGELKQFKMDDPTPLPDDYVEQLQAFYAAPVHPPPSIDSDWMVRFKRIHNVSLEEFEQDHISDIDDNWNVMLNSPITCADQAA